MHHIVIAWNLSNGKRYSWHCAVDIGHWTINTIVLQTPTPVAKGHLINTIIFFEWKCVKCRTLFMRCFLSPPLTCTIFTRNCEISVLFTLHSICSIDLIEKMFNCNTMHVFDCELNEYTFLTPINIVWRQLVDGCVRQFFFLSLYRTNQNKRTSHTTQTNIP